MTSLVASIKKRLPGVTGLRDKVLYKRYRFIIRSLHLLGLGDLLLGQPFSAYEEREASSNFHLLHPAELVDLSPPGRPYTDDIFLRCCQTISQGHFERRSIFTCEFANAKFSPENGLVYDSRWRNIVEAILNDGRFYIFRKTFRPRSLTRRAGVFSSVQHPWHFNNWHWTVDSLPQIHSLALHMQGRPLTLLMSNALGRVHRDSLQAILPANFTVEYVNPHEWFDLETFVVPSHVSSVANGCFPAEYYDFIRNNTFNRLHTRKLDLPCGRFYISRGRAKHRRVLNEPELLALLEPLGFQMIFVEDYTFAEQVELFRNAEAIVSPHGAALGGIIYSDHAKVCVLYPEQRPAGYFFTLARGVGLEHFCTKDDRTEDDDFQVDLTVLRHVLTEEMHLAPSALPVLQTASA